MRGRDRPVDRRVPQCATSTTDSRRRRSVESASKQHSRALSDRVPAVPHSPGTRSNLTDSSAAQELLVRSRSAVGRLNLGGLAFHRPCRADDVAWTTTTAIPRRVPEVNHTPRELQHGQRASSARLASPRSRPPAGRTSTRSSRGPARDRPGAAQIGTPLPLRHCVANLVHRVDLSRTRRGRSPRPPSCRPHRSFPRARLRPRRR
jgi:hypothetical protein